MEDMKKAQELRVDEVSVQKLRENHETIQKLTSQLQEMHEHMNSMNDLGDFQDVESNYSGRWSYVSSQFAMIPSSRSMRCLDKRLLLDTWNTTGLHFWSKLCSRFFFWRGLISLCSDSFWRRSNYFLSS